MGKYLCEFCDKGIMCAPHTCPVYYFAECPEFDTAEDMVRELTELRDNIDKFLKNFAEKA